MSSVKFTQIILLHIIKKMACVGGDSFFFCDVLTLHVQQLHVLDVCVTVLHWYNDVSNQQDATTFSFINLFKSALHVSGKIIARNMLS